MFKIPCNNCKGHGKLENYKHVQDGICFKCSGSGYIEVSKEIYADYQEMQKRASQGQYILFNNGSIEYYSTKKQIEKLYGNFFTGQYGSYSVHVSYKDKNIVYSNNTKNNDSFTEETDKQYKKFIQSKIEKQRKILIGETDKEFIEMITTKIKELERLI